MKSRYVTVLGAGLMAAAAASVFAQGGAPAPQQIAHPTQNCTLTPAQIAENRKAALAFFAPGADRLALADPSYKQHNPVFKKRAEENKVSDFEEYKAAFAPRGGGPGGGGGGRAANPNAPQPPGPNNPLEIVTTECDVTTVIHRTWRQDPVTPGRWFEAFTFDTFKVKDGKLVEHWDSAVIAAPNPNAPGGAPGGAPAGGAPARGN